MANVPAEVVAEFDAWLDEYASAWEGDVREHLAGLADDNQTPVQESEWTAFTGPKGGKGWKNASGTVHYGDRPPVAGETPDSIDDGTSKARQALDYAASVPAAIAGKVKAKVREKYAKLESRYGSRWSKAIIAAALAGIPVPAPGASFALAAPVVALAELHRAFSGSGSGPAAVAEQEEGEMTQDEIAEAAQELISELTAEFSEE